MTGDEGVPNDDSSRSRAKRGRDPTSTALTAASPNAAPQSVRIIDRVGGSKRDPFEVDDRFEEFDV